MAHYTVVSMDNCSFCNKAKDLLIEHRLPFQEFSISDHNSIRELIKSLGLRKVPQIFHGSERIGGFSELQAYLQTNQ